jgi:hypothetical protein
VRVEATSSRSTLNGAVGTIHGYGTSRYLVRIDDEPAFGRYAGAWMRCPESILRPVASPPPSAALPRRARAAPRFTKPTPDWVRELVEQVLADHDAPLREFIWKPATNGRRLRTLGRGSRQRVTIYDNRGVDEQRMTVLHELAHVIDDFPGHKPRFWDVCWRLYRDYGVDLEAARAATARRRGASASYRRVIGE